MCEYRREFCGTDFSGACEFILGRTVHWLPGDCGRTHAGMTWTVLQQLPGGVVRVGGDGRANPYAGVYYTVSGALSIGEQQRTSWNCMISVAGPEDRWRYCRV